MAASSIPKILENSLIVILWACCRVRSRILLPFCFASLRIIFLEFIVNPRKSISCFSVREDFFGGTLKLIAYLSIT